MNKLNIYAGYSLVSKKKINITYEFERFKQLIRQNHRQGSFYVESVSCFDSDEQIGERFPPLGPIPMFAKCPICSGNGPTRVEILSENYEERLGRYEFYHEPDCQGSQLYSLNLRKVVESADVTMREIIFQKIGQYPEEIDRMVAYESIFPKRGEMKLSYSTKPNFFMNSTQVNIVVPGSQLVNQKDQKTTMTMLKNGTITFSNVPFYTKSGSVVMEDYMRYLASIIPDLAQSTPVTTTIRTTLHLVDVSKESIDPSLQEAIDELDLKANIIVNRPSVQITINRESDPSIGHLTTIVEGIYQIFNSSNYKIIKVKTNIYEKNVVPARFLADTAEKKQPSCRKEHRPLPFSFDGIPPKRNTYVKLDGTVSKKIFRYDETGRKTFLYEPCCGTLSVKGDPNGYFKYRYHMPPSYVLNELRNNLENPLESVQMKIQQLKGLKFGGPVHTLIRRVLYGFPNSLFPEDTPAAVNYTEPQDQTATGESRYRRGILSLYQEGDREGLLNIVRCYLQDLLQKREDEYEENVYHFRVELKSEKIAQLKYPRSDEPVATIKIDSKFELPYIKGGVVYEFMCNYNRSYRYKTDTIQYVYDDNAPFLFVHPIVAVKPEEIMDDDTVWNALNDTNFLT